MKKERRFAEMASMPEESSMNIVPPVVSDAEPTDSAKETQKRNRQTSTINGNLNIRIPKSLHLQLDEEAKDEGVSLEEYIIYKLAK